MEHSASITRRVIVGANAVRGWFETPPGKRLQRIVSLGLSILILVILFRAIAGIGWRQVVAALPASPWFWLCFTLSYLLLPIIDWWIYRRWWTLRWRSIAVFLKMRVLNEALFSYAGHTYLMVWAADRFGIVFDPDVPAARLLGRGDGPGVDPATSPFAAVKDMAITSGLAGNLMTLLMLLLALLLDNDGVLAAAIDPAALKTLVWTFGVLIVLNIGIVVQRNRVMSLPPAENMRAFWWHLFRVTAAHFLFVATWIIALPAIGIATWILLGALRLVIGRMPLPNKELLFAAVAVGLTGEASVALAALMAAQGALHLVFHGLAWIAAAGIEATAPAGARG